jgi:hypothetical protein
VLGVLRIVEEIMDKRPDAHIVINSLLPMTALRGDFYPKMTDLAESFTNATNKKSLPSKNNQHNRRLFSVVGEHQEFHYRILKGDNKTDRIKDKVVEDTAPVEEDELIKEREQALKEELARERLSKFKRMRMSNPRMRDQVLVDRSRMKKFRPGRIRKNKLPLWTSVKSVNAALLKFAEKHNKHVTFFDATAIFINKPRANKNEVYLKRGLTSPKGIPTPMGYQILIGKILEALRPIITSIELDEDATNNDHLSDDYMKHIDDDHAREKEPGDVDEDDFLPKMIVGDGTDVDDTTDLYHIGTNQAIDQPNIDYDDLSMNDD